MAFVVTQACFGCKHTHCVAVCPTDSFHEGEQMLFIDPESCTDCGACAMECPVEAIYQEEDLPEAQRPFIAFNAEMSRSCPPITTRRA